MDIEGLSVGSGLGAVIMGVVAYIRTRGQNVDTKVDAGAQVQVTETGMVPKLLARIESLEAKTDDLREELHETDRRCEEQRKSDREECERHTEERVRTAVDCVTREMSRNLHALLDIWQRSPAVTDSMSEELEAVRRRSVTPPGEWRLDVLTPHTEDDGA